MSPNFDEQHALRATIEKAAHDIDLHAMRRKLANYAAETFEVCGRALELSGHLIGPDRLDSKSPFGHGSDEVAAIGFLLRVLHQLVEGSCRLFEADLVYSAAALVRQVVEIEYLAWAFDTRDHDAERWLRSNKAEREAFFSPRKLRAAAAGKFRGQDYSYHCELGGHPVPTGRTLLWDKDGISEELLLVDLLGHAGRVWDHVVSWAGKQSHGGLVLKHREEMLQNFVGWKGKDPLAHLPPPA